MILQHPFSLWTFRKMMIVMFVGCMSFSSAGNRSMLAGSAIQAHPVCRQDLDAGQHSRGPARRRRHQELQAPSLYTHPQTIPSAWPLTCR